MMFALVYTFTDRYRSRYPRFMGIACYAGSGYRLCFSEISLAVCNAALQNNVSADSATFYTCTDV